MTRTTAPVSETSHSIRLADLFCGQGGAGMGYARAGFEVVGFDIEPQPRYPFAFVQSNALEVDLSGFDVVHASPPCQRYSIYSRNMGTADAHPDLVAAVRSLLRSSGKLYVIENVEGAPLEGPILLCGSMFGLKVRRHRLFENNLRRLVLAPPCRHVEPAIPVFGHGAPQWHRRKFGRNISLEEKRQAMGGIDWMNRDGLSEAIPPAYTEFLGRHLREELRHAA